MASVGMACVLAGGSLTSFAQVSESAPPSARATGAGPVVPGAAPPSAASLSGPFASLERAGFDQGERNALIIGATTAAFAAYGRAKWWDQGFGGGFKSRGEGWFGRGTQYGGADKLGHGFTNYASTRLLTRAFQAAGNAHEDSVRLAAWTSVGIFTGIEVLDGFSRNYRFSGEDALMNVAGAGLGVLMENQPGLDEKFDFRFGYRPSAGSGFDPFGDYSGQRYLLVAKADGFDGLRRAPVLRYLELGVGYQARFTPGGERRRDAYVGVSLNLSRLLADGAYGGQSGSTPFQRSVEMAFELVQFPTAAYARRGID
jgi:hypothetical protein